MVDKFSRPLCKTACEATVETDVASKFQLRMISFTNETQEAFTVFVAMTDLEYEGFRGQNQKNLDSFRNDGRIIHTVRGDAPSDEDRGAALAAFNHRYGSKTVRGGPTVS
jgi:hypothetical protein